ncbi:MAG: hypothetical protein ACO1RX_12795 [Candidatus Sericytochromatia bacterium]
MNIQLRQTGPLPVPSFTEPSTSTPSPVAKPPAPPTTPQAVADSTQVQAIQGESLSQVVLFPDVASAPATAPAAPAPASGEIKPSANQLQAQRTLNSLYRRHVENPNGTRITLDFQLAKLSQESSPLAIEQFHNALAELGDKLSRQPAEPLSAADVSRLNAALKYFGVMTDGKDIYNLATRRAAAPGERRRPAPLAMHELEMLKNVSSTLLEAQSGSGTASARSASALLATVRSDQTAYRSLMSEFETTLVESEALLADLLPKLEAVNTAITGKLAEHGAVVGRIQTESAKLERLQAVVPVLLDPSTPVTPAQVPALNAALAPLELEIQSTPEGGLSFTRNGQTVSEPDFRQAVAEGIQTQQGVVAGLRADLVRTEQDLSNLRQQSDGLSSEIGRISDTLKKDREALVDKAKGLANENLNELLSLRNDPTRWNSLSPAEQQETEALIASIQADIAKMNGLESRSQRQIDGATQALKATEKLRTQLDEALAITRKVLNQLNELLFKGEELLKDLGIGSGDNDARTAELIATANALADTLNLTPIPDLSAFHRMADDWMKAVAESARESLAHHRATQNTDMQASRQWERSAESVREKLHYHQQQLGELDDRRREELQAALQAHTQLLHTLQTP